MRAGRAARVAVLALTPWLLAASDPIGDVTGCRGGDATGAPDLVEARGEILEEGTSARWQLTFAEPLEVPDRHGHPFRVDVAIRDPDVPPVSFAYYHRINRLVRVDATIPHRTWILLLPEHGVNVYNPPIVEGRTMTIQIPGRTISEEGDPSGTQPGLEELRWTVIVRDERSCDVLGDGRAQERLAPTSDTPSETPVPQTPAPRAPEATGGTSPWISAGAVALVLAIGAFAVIRARR
jgi:hypothetical protein